MTTIVMAPHVPKFRILYAPRELFRVLCHLLPYFAINCQESHGHSPGNMVYMQTTPTKVVGVPCRKGISTEIGSQRERLSHVLSAVATSNCRQWRETRPRNPEFLSVLAGRYFASGLPPFFRLACGRLLLHTACSQSTGPPSLLFRHQVSKYFLMDGRQYVGRGHG